jgi:uncharacterized membrane protein
MMARSVFAVFAGFLAVVVLSLGTDQVLHMLEVYPPWGQPMWETHLNALALSYRIVYTLLGGFITARLAPDAQMRHVMILALIGLAAGTAGAIAAITQADLGPSWYPIALAVTAYPCTWFGGRLGAGPRTLKRALYG